VQSLPQLRQLGDEVQGEVCFGRFIPVVGWWLIEFMPGWVDDLCGLFCCSCCCHCMSLLAGGRYQGHKKTEKFLPVGAIITVVGELRGTASAACTASVELPGQAADMARGAFLHQQQDHH